MNSWFDAGIAKQVGIGKDIKLISYTQPFANQMPNPKNDSEALCVR